MVLTAAQLTSFRDDGYLVIENFVAESSLTALRQRAGELEDQAIAEDASTVFSTTDPAHGEDPWFLESGDKIRGFFEAEGRRLNKLGHALHDLDPVFSDFCRTPELAGAFADLGMHMPQLVQSMYIFKHPNIGGEVTWHTDHSFLWTEPRSVVGAWFAIDDATTENGCMWAIPGGHALDVKSRFVREGNVATTTVFDDTGYPIDQAVALPASAGTLILLDGALPHWSDRNRSAHPRHAFTLHVVDGTADWQDENWLRRDDSLPFRGFVDA